MRIAKIAPLSLMLAGLATPALAIEQGDTYVGGGFSMVTVDIDTFDDVDPTAAVGRLGYGVTDNIAIEGRLGFGLSDDELENTDVDVEIDQLAGVYGVAHLPLGEAFSLYGLAGFTYGELSYAAPGTSFTVDEDDTDFSYGIGGQFDVSDNVAAFVEWAQYFDESDYEITGVTVGANFNF